MHSTLSQKLRKGYVPNKRNKKRRIKTIMGHSPLSKAVCLSVHKGSPKKPNSANRTFAKCQINLKINIKGEKKYMKYNEQNKIPNKIIRVYIPGEKNNISPHSYIMFQPDKIQDLPGVYFSAKRGKYDLNGVEGRKSSRSRYGVKKVNK